MADASARNSFKVLHTSLRTLQNFENTFEHILTQPARHALETCFFTLFWQTDHDFVTGLRGSGRSRII